MFSWIPGLSTIKSWLLGSLALGTAILFGLWKVSQLGRVKDKVKGINRARDTEKRANKAALEGLQREQDEINNTDTKRRDFN